ncbi:MAG: hypothetical protein K5985_06900 [Lachnospiraceae bacterium]|nr:hypothetical protein [Lachnospiraceae bacterium]
MKELVKNYWLSFLLALVIAAFTLLCLKADDELYLPFDAFSVKAEKYDTGEGVITIPSGADKTPDGIFALSKSFDLPRGNYSASVEYEFPEDGSLRLMDGETILGEIPLKAARIKDEFTFSLSRRANDFRISLSCPSSGEIIFKNISLKADRLLFRDHLFLGLLLILAVFLVPALSRRGIFTLRTLCAAGCIIFASYPLFSEALIAGHDTVFHMMRIEGIADAVLDGQFPAVIYPEAVYGHGYLGALYPNLFLYIPAFLRLINVSASGAYRFFYVVINAASFAAAYFAVKTVLKNSSFALFAGILFCLSPFRLIDVYYRSTLGECLAFLFFPLLLAGLYNILIGDEEAYLPLVIGMSGMVESHILSALYGGAICLVFCLAFLPELVKKTRILSLLKAAFATLLLNLAFFVPFFYYRSQNLQLDATIRRFNPKELALSLSEVFRILPYLYSDNEYTLLPRTMVPVLGLSGLLGLLFTGAYLLGEKKKEALRKFVSLSFALELFCVYFSTELFPWATLEKLTGLYYHLYLLEHPWRVFEIAVSLLCITLPVSLCRLGALKGYRFAAAAVVVIISLITASLQLDLFENRRSTIEPLTGNTAWSHNVDYMPSNFTAMEDYKGKQAPLPSPGVELTEYKKKGTTVDLIYSASPEDCFVDLPLLYYYGYRASDGNGNGLFLSESPAGTLRLFLPPAMNARVHLSFTQPWFNYASLALSLLTAAFLTLTVIVRGRKKLAQKSGAVKNNP